MKELCSELARKHFRDLIRVDIDIEIDPEINNFFYCVISVVLPTGTDIEKNLENDENFAKELLPQIPESLAVHIVFSTKFEELKGDE